MFVNWQVMETKQMIYLVTEYASGGEIYGMYFVTVRYCSYLRIEPNWRFIMLLFCSLCQFDSRFNWYDFRGVKQLRKDMLMRFLLLSYYLLLNTQCVHNNGSCHSCATLFTVFASVSKNWAQNCVVSCPLRVLLWKRLPRMKS